MDNEKAKVMLQYVKVLLLKHGYRDPDIDTAMDMAIEHFDDGKSHDNFYDNFLTRWA